MIVNEALFTVLQKRKIFEWIRNQAIGTQYNASSDEYMGIGT
jgi:hypothetical protein